MAKKKINKLVKEIESIGLSNRKKNLPITCAAGPGETNETALERWAKSHIDDELKEFTVGYFVGQRGVTGKLKKITHQIKRYPRLEYVLQQEIDANVGVWESELELAQESGNKKAEEDLRSNGPEGHGLECSVSNGCFDEKVTGIGRAPHGLPLRIISVEPVNDEEACLAMMAYLEEADGDGYFKDLFPQSDWYDLFRIDKFDGLKNLSISSILDFAKEKFSLHFAITNDIYGEYICSGTMIEKEIVKRANFWGQQGGYMDKLLCNEDWLSCGQPDRITKTFRFNYLNARALEETSDLTNSTQTEILESLMQDHIGSYVLKSINNQKNSGGMLDVIRADFYKWKAAVDNLCLFKIPESIDGFKSNKDNNPEQTEKEKSGALKEIKQQLKVIYKDICKINGEEANLVEEPDEEERRGLAFGREGQMNFVVSPKVSPVKKSPILNEAMHINPFVFDGKQPEFIYISAFYCGDFSFMAIVGYQLKVSEYHSVEEVVKNFNSEFEKLIGHKLGVNKVAKLSTNLINHLNGRDVIEFPTCDFIIPDLRTIDESWLEENVENPDWWNC